MNLYISTVIAEAKYGSDCVCVGCGEGVTINWPHTVEDCLQCLTNRISKLEDKVKQQALRDKKRGGRHGKTVSR